MTSHLTTKSPLVTPSQILRNNVYGKIYVSELIDASERAIVA